MNGTIKVVTVGAVIVLLAIGSIAEAGRVKGYTRRDGMYVQGHRRSNPDSYRYNNYGSKSRGGRQRDEFSSGFGATNRSNPSWGWRDNDNDGTLNFLDSD